MQRNGGDRDLGAANVNAKKKRHVYVLINVTSLNPNVTCVPSAIQDGQALCSCEFDRQQHILDARVKMHGRTLKDNLFNLAFHLIQ